MSKLRKITLVLSFCAVLSMGMFVGGCKDDPTTSTVQAKTTTPLCLNCGQIKGSDQCCNSEAEKCEKCGLAKGSPGCCVIPKDAEKCELCNKCGQIAGSENCCAPDAEKCADCGLAKGSPGCCKLPKAGS